MQPKRLAVTLLVAAALATAASNAARAAISSAAACGFAPVLALWGSDETRALHELRAALDLYGVVLADTRIEPKLKQIADATADSLADFDLQKAYELLPNANSTAHELRVLAGRSGAAYAVRMAKPGEAFEANASGKRRALGDASLLLRLTKPKPSDDDHYVLNARAAVAIGGIAWPDVLAAQRAWLQLLTQTHAGSDPAERPMSGLRQSALAANPNLDADEIETLAVLWEAFPNSARLLSALVRIDDLRSDSADGRAQHLRVSYRLTPERLRERYPALASYASDLERLLRLSATLRDEQGRTIVRFDFDTQKLLGHAELHVAEGKLVPFDAQHDYLEAPLEPDHGAHELELQAQGDVRMLGIHASFRDVRGRLDYAPTDHGGRIAAQVTHVPTVEISGAALGLVPPALIDVFIPGDLDGLIKKLTSSACHGNGGRGITLDGQLTQGTDAVSTVEANLAVELLDNFLIRLGVGYWNDHLRPDEKVQADLHRLANDAQRALLADTQRYALGARLRAR